MSARQNAGFDPDFADLVKGASIGTALVVEDLVSEDALAQFLVILFQLGFTFRIFFGQGGQQFFFEGANEFVAFGFRVLRRVEGIAKPRADLGFETFGVRFVKFRRSYGALLLP